MPGGIHPPLEVIASWPAPNYVHPERRSWGLVALCAVLFTITTIVVVMRLVARFHLQRNAGLDDLFIVLSYLIAAALAISVALASKAYGFDRHVWDLPMETLIQSRKITFVIECFYVASTSLTRISILFFYRRLASGSISSWFIWCVQGDIALCIMYLMVFETTLFAGCRPMDAFWNRVDPIWTATHQTFCLDETTNLYTASFLSAALDFATCVMPMILFRNLQMSRRQKIALSSVFGLGFFTCFCGMLRIRYIHRVFFETYDVTWAAQPIWIWTVLEALLAIDCASAPVLKIFFRRYFGETDLTSTRIYQLANKSRQSIVKFISLTKPSRVHERHRKRAGSDEGMDYQCRSQPSEVFDIPPADISDRAVSLANGMADPLAHTLEDIHSTSAYQDVRNPKRVAAESTLILPIRAVSRAETIESFEWNSISVHNEHVQRAPGRHQ